LFYLLATHITHNPLHAIVQGSSGSGKTHLLNSVVDLMPETRVQNATDLSSKVLYYFEQEDLKNTIIHIEDLDGAAGALLPLRELASKSEIIRLVVVKDKNGRSRPARQKVQGPVSIAGTTTQETVYEDNANRSFLLEVDSSKQQDEKILNYQRMKESGLVRKDQEREAQRKLQDLILTLKNVTIKNPYAVELTLPDKVFKPRRANMHYLNFIRAVTLMHQWQREKQVDEQTGEEYIEVTLEDIGIANELMKEVLLKKSDELSGACRVFFESIKSKLEEETSTFTAQEIRTDLRMHPSSFSRYMKQLKERGYIQKVKGKTKGSTYQYKVLVWNDYQLLKQGIAQMDKVLEQLQKKSKE
jgi:predicted transcriptional regulator/energy-coupling factor transporter ATP-binding protein EcfA2